MDHPSSEVRLTEQEIDEARIAFLKFDADQSGSIDQFELKKVLEHMNVKVSDSDVFQMISEVDEDNSGAIEFQEFLNVMENKKRAESIGDGAEILAAYVACGGNPDKTGHVDRRTITRIIKDDFGLDIDIEKLIDGVDTDGSGEMEFDEFELLLSGKTGQT